MVSTLRKAARKPRRSARDTTATSTGTPLGRRGVRGEGRINARIGYPMDESWRTRVRPIKPVAPVTRIMFGIIAEGMVDTKTGTHYALSRFYRNVALSDSE